MGGLSRPGRFCLLLLTAHHISAQAIGEFKRMPDLRGQSFGLENFLLQPFNIASQNEERERGPSRSSKRREPHPDSYSVQFEVKNEDFDVDRLVPTLPGASIIFNQADLNRDFKPVHEDAEDRPPPVRRPAANERQPQRKRKLPSLEEEIQSLTSEGQPERRKQPTLEEELESLALPGSNPLQRKRKLQTLEEEIQSLSSPSNERSPEKKRPSIEDEIQSLPKRRLPPPDRRPLEKPSEFMVSLTEHVEPFPSPLEDRPRKRVMKRRRKRPSTPQPELSEEDEKLLDGQPIKDIEDNLFSSVPTSYQQTVKDTTGAESIVIEHGPPRRKLPGGYKRPQPAQSIYREGEGKGEGRGEARYHDKLLTEATRNVPHREIIESELGRLPDVIVPTTDNPGESTQRLKTLLKQQNGQLSLSELLQTQNLSLADFLKGNPGALSALGGTKVKSDKPTESPFEPEAEKPKTESKSHIPKISSKSRPFSKHFNSTKPMRRGPITTTTSTSTSSTSTTTEEPEQNLPKKLQIIEVTSEKTQYNGFAPKRPRLRIGQKSENRFSNYSREKTEEPPTEKSTTTTEKERNETEEERDQEEVEIENELFHTKGPISKPTTQQPQEALTTERASSKRFGEFRPKAKIDRRKPSDSTTEGSTMTEAKETTIISTTTEEIKTTKESRSRVRIPFMSVNNPEISVILPSKKPNTTTEKPRSSPVIKDRINVFKRLNSEEKVTNENTAESRERGGEPGVVFTTRPLSTTTPATSRNPVASASTEEPVMGSETSDEIVELLKTGSNAQRLQRILAARNMTVNELVEKRANSSRQPNVTHLFDKKPDAQLTGKYKIAELNDNGYPSTEKPRAPHTTKRVLPVFDILSPNYKMDSNDKIRVKSEVVKAPTHIFDELFVDESVVRPIKMSDGDEMREPKSFDTSEKEFYSNHRSHVNLSPGVEGRAKPPIPLWNVDKISSSSPYGYPTYDLNNNLDRTSTEPSKPVEEEILIVETIRNDDANSRLKSSINDILKERVEVKDVKEDAAIIPPAVKSAIIASGVVMGIALIVFVAIFAACGWKQRQFRLRARSSILNDSIDGSTRKAIRRTGTLSPVSFKRSALYKKSIDFDTESSVSGSSNTSSYLWNTLKHTFQSRNSTLKNREEKEEKIQERENRSRRNTLCREDERPRRNTLSRDESLREPRDMDLPLPRRNTLTRERDDTRRDSFVSRDTLSHDHTRDTLSRDTGMARDSLSRDLVRTESRRSSCFRDERRPSHSQMMRDGERCSFKTIDPDRQIIQTSVNFKRGGFNGSSRHFDACDHFN